MNHTLHSDVMLPGTYLRLRRAAHGLTTRDLARQLIALPLARPGPVAIFVNRMAARLHDAETGAEHLLPAQAALVAQIVPFEPQVYERLIALTAAPGLSLPVPQLCRVCACSWHMACVDRSGAPCSWCEDDSTMCTRCESRIRSFATSLFRFAHGPMPTSAAELRSAAHAHGVRL